MKEDDLRALMGQMTLAEKVGQLVQLDGGCFGASDVATGPRAKLGVTQADVDVCGSVLNVLGADEVRRIQDAYLERSRLKVPLPFMADIIYGYQTCYPIPLAQACSFDTDRVRDNYALVAEEAAADGCMVTFSPAVDVARDARWGRVMEMPGEDPYLSARFAAAAVEGFQGGLDEGRGMAACVKHFAGYGAVEGGREYNTVDMSERRFRQDYLSPYKAAVDAGARLVMTSFNTVDMVPATANEWLMRDVLRDEWGFDGVVITDYAAIHELVFHGVAADDREAALLAIRAGVDIDMKTSCYAANLAGLVAEGLLDEAAIEEGCWRVLLLKNELGLFEDPYRGCSAERAAAVACTPDRISSVREMCAESLVLLENKDVDGSPALPLAKVGERLALVGPYADSQDIVGMWAIHADRSHSRSVREAMAAVLGHDPAYAKGCETLLDVSFLGSFAKFAGGGSEDPRTPEELEAEALAVAAGVDTVVLCLGEHMLQSGEAGARTDIRLPDHQVALAAKIKALGKKVVAVLFNGRPLVLTDLLPHVDAILEAWYPGTAGGDAVCDILFGDVNPSGRLAMSFPETSGQMPLYYAQFSTGRPKGGSHEGRFVTGYLDAPNEGLYPFGYGLSYHSARLTGLRLSADTLRPGETLRATVTLSNDSDIAGTDVVQLYVRDLVGSVVRPIKELRGYQRVATRPGERVEVSFDITEEMLRFWRRDMTYGSEPGAFQVMVGFNSQTTASVDFELVG